MSVPSNLIPTRITQLPTAPVADEDSLMMIVYQGNNYKIRVGDLLSVAGVPITRQVIAGTGMTGGGALSSNVTLSVAVGGIGGTQLDATGVTPGVYGSTSNIPVFTVDTNGRVTTATSTPVAVQSITGTANQIAISAGPTVAIANNPILPGSGGVILPVGTTGQRGTATDGNLRYNVTTASFEGYANGAWGSIVSGAGVNSITFGTTGLTPSTSTTGAVTVAGTLAVANGGTGVVTSTGTGSVVLSTSPTLVTPALGTPSALVGTNITGTAASLTAGNVTTNANLTGAVTSVGNTTSLGSFTSAQLATALTDETGSGANVFATSPTLVTPALGTPSALVGTNITGLPLTTGVTGTLPIANGGTNGTATPTAGTIAYGNGTAIAYTAAGTIGQVLTSNGAGAPSWSTGGGTVTSASVVSANGFAGTVATATTTPAITLTTTITGILKGNGTAISAATSGTDYAPATSGASILYGNGSGGFNNVTIGSGVAFAGGTLSATGSGGTVTSVTGTSPVVSSGGATPAISMPAATTSVDGYLTSTDWTTFNNKSNTNGTVTSVAALTLGTSGTDLSSTVATGTTTPVITLQVPTASASNRGVLSAADWTTFNNKGSGTVTSVTGTSPVVSSGGATPAISMPAATTSVNGYLTSTDWTTFNNKQPAGSYLVNGGALGTPSSGTVTNLTGTASININGTVGATTANTGAFTTLTTTSTINSITVGLGAGSVSTNTAIGPSALQANTSGINNSANAYRTLYSNTTGSYNTATGSSALNQNTSGLNNTALGYQSLLNVTTSSDNTAVGYNAGYGNITGANCTAIGSGALQGANASNNTALGFSSGSAITTGAKNVIIGSYTGSAAPISATGNNYVVLSDGDGNVRQYIDSSGNTTFNGTVTATGISGGTF